MKTPFNKYAGFKILGIPLKSEEPQSPIKISSTANSFSKKNVVEIFEQQVERYPQNIAIVCNDVSLSYKQLNNYANGFSHHLIDKGAGKEALIPICIERSLQMIIGVLAILKCGSAYVPLDPDYPADRIRFILEDIKAQFCISSPLCSSKITGAKNIDVLKLDTGLAEVSFEMQNKPNVNVKPNDLAYVIYTSGSTGMPKGVMIEHKGLANLSLIQAAYFGLRPGISTLQVASFGFDASCSEIFTSLLSGGCLVIPQKQDLLSAERFERLVNKYHVNVATLAPSFQFVVKDFLGTITTVISAGEPLNEHICKELQAKGIRFINAYGPTENTVCVSMSDNPIRQDHIISIGKPITNVCVHIMDENGQLCEVDKPGEICVSGVQVARGYLNRPDLTNDRFVVNPFANGAEDIMMYRTGDFGRWLSDETIEFIGRQDDQIKIRGYRIELGEIENTLQHCTLVKQAVVLVKGDDNYNKQLVAYVIPSGDFDKASMIAYLKRKLPDYMVPSSFIQMNSFPVTAHGKIDKKVLDADVYNVVRDLIPPVNDTEEKIVKICQKVLGVNRLGTNENFFDLGGSSLTVIQVVTNAKQEGFELEAADFFTHQTIQDIARLINKRQQEKRQSGASQQASEQERTISVVCFHKKGTKTPFFFMSPGFSVFNELVSFLGEDQPFYFFIPKPYISVESIATDYILEMKKIQPQGPYYLGGYCGFGEVAFEMAHQLSAQGEVVSFVALLEFYSPSAIKPIVYKDRVKFYKQELQSASIKRGMRILFQFLYRKIRKVQKNTSRVIDQTMYNLPEKAGYLIEKNKYIVKPYKGKILLFRAQNRTARISDDPYMGWFDYLQGEVQIYTIEGDHKTIFDKKGASEISKKLKENRI